MVVVLSALVADTGSLAALHVILEADLVLAESYLVWGEVEVAGTYRVEVTHHRHGSMCHTDIGVRAEVYRPIPCRSTLDTHTGEGLMMDHDLGVGLVVLEEDVVAGLVLLDQGIL